MLKRVAHIGDCTGNPDQVPEDPENVHERSQVHRKRVNVMNLVNISR